jgi:hypothetical protein
VRTLGKGGTRCPQCVGIDAASPPDIRAFVESFAIVFGEDDPPFNFVKKQLSITNRETR